MSWTDKKSIKTINQLGKEFNIKYFIETGTFRGINARVYSNYFENVLSCELNKEYFDIAVHNTKDIENIKLYLSDSFSFLKTTRIINGYKLYYLDAHFYDPTLPIDQRFVVKKELNALRNCEDCIIVIHDFDNKELGHLVYDGISLNMDIIIDQLKEVNPNFFFYTNRFQDCDPITLNDVKNNTVIGVPDTDETKDTIDFVWSSKEKTYRGILYCVPIELDLNKYNLRML